MDINSLLSSQESAARRGSGQHHHHPLSNAQLSPKSVSRARRGGQPILQRTASSPQNYSRGVTSPLAPAGFHQAKYAPIGPTSASPSPLGPGRSHPGSYGSPSGEHRNPLTSSHMIPPPHQPIRRASLDKTDYLSAGDLAAMQHHTHTQLQQHQTAAHNSRGIRTSISHEVLRSPSISTPPLTRNNSIVPPAIDLTTSTDVPTLTPRTFTANSLSKAELQTISDLTKRLAENSFLQDAHQQLINLLHQGFIAHVFPSNSYANFQDPAAYQLVSEMRQARQAMDSRVPVGEQLWLDWIQDEIMLAKTTEQRVAVMELCQKAVQDEAGSAKLWRLYGDWMSLLYKISHTLPGGYEWNSLEQHDQIGPILRSQSWSKEEKIVGAEVFGWNPMLDVWIHGVKATEWHMNDSHLVWDPYVEILLHDLSRYPSPDKVKHVWTFYAERLQKPHATWEDTFQGFSQFVTANYDNSIYEDTMVAAKKQSARSKYEYEQRQEFEHKLQRAEEERDLTAELPAMTEYLEWEAAQLRKKNASPFSLDLYIALLERANLRFPTASEWWEDHVDLITENSDAERDLLPLLHRATRHCPWSGNLWSKYIYALEASSRPFEELEDVKHRATGTGLLEELGGMDELIKVYNSWCGYLRRRAFSDGAGEDERDVAEMGIRSVIENVKDVGARKYGKEFKGDPLFRAERIYLKFLPQMGRYDEARETWNKLTATHGDMYDFWDRYYLWEMTIWAKETKFGETPVKATRVLQQAIRRPNLDYPEKMLELYIHHCSQHETINRLQEAHAEVRRVGKQLTKRREQEAAEAARAQTIAQQQQQYQHHQNQPPHSPQQQPPHTGEVFASYEDDLQAQSKRKREEEDLSESPNKRARAEGEEEDPEHMRASSSATAQMKRDRENTTVIVRHLPAGTTEKRVRQFFRDCGEILSLQITAGDNEDEETAMLEFETIEDVLAAQTKTMKSLDGNPIDVQIGSGTTLWVTNYPPEADEQFLRDLFKDCGEIVEIRFPSLKYNTHRRFCYIQFLTASQAVTASNLDGKALPGNLKLTAKISDPSARKDRMGAMQDGREIFIGNVSYNATERELRSLFEKFGTIESVRIPRNMAGKSKSIAFIVFSKKEEAEAALKLNLHDFKDRLLKVEISRPNAQGAKRSAVSIISSASPEPSGEPRESPSATVPLSEKSGATKDYRDRSVILGNVPDTVNDARIRTLMEKYGPLRKIILRPEKNEALVEFEEVKSVGKAEMSGGGVELAPGMNITVSAMAEKGAARRNEVVQRNGFGNTFVRHQVSRPGQVGTSKRGGRGGLGFRSVGSSARPKNAGASDGGKNETESYEPRDDEPKDVEMSNGTDKLQVEAQVSDETEQKPGAGAAKSNDDFRAMLEKGE